MAKRLQVLSYRCSLGDVKYCFLLLSATLCPWQVLTAEEEGNMQVLR